MCYIPKEMGKCYLLETLTTCETGCKRFVIPMNRKEKQVLIVGNQFTKYTDTNLTKENFQI